MKKSKYIKIKPFDMQFYGKRKSFFNGKNKDNSKTNFIKSHSFPYPSTIYGALFSAFLAIKKRQNKIGKGNKEIKNYIDSLTEEIDKYDRKLKKILNIKNIYLYDKKLMKIYLKAPYDIHYNSNKIGFVDRVLDYNLLYNLPEYKKIKNEFLSMEGYYNYLKKGRAKIISTDELISKNYRIGISINEKRVAEDSQLYKTENYQFNSDSLTFLVEYEKNSIFELKNKGFLLLGGQGKTAKYKICDYKEVKNIEIIKKYFEYDEIYFDNNIEERIEVVKAIFHTDVYGKFITEIVNSFDKTHVISGGEYSLGGYDYSKQQVKELEKVFNAGTVIYIYNNKINYIRDKINEISDVLSYNTFKGFNKYKLYNIIKKENKNE